mmetsp:Transcript_68053/g.142112  ORF Transcript_68053/g.142112 Transcript_68053/m.142112 type:complete len:592 (+) Transcript_68053:43-1818(+)
MRHGVNLPQLQIPIRESSGPKASPSPAFSAVSSLAFSTLSSPIGTQRTDCAALPFEEDSMTTREAAGSREVTAKLDVSEWLRPVESRLSARITALESVVESRCGTLEQRVKDQHWALDNFHGLQERLESRLVKERDERQANFASLDMKVTALEGQYNNLQKCVDDFRKEIKTHREEVDTKWNGMFESFENHLRRLLALVAQLPSPTTTRTPGEDGESAEQQRTSSFQNMSLQEGLQKLQNLQMQKMQQQQQQQQQHSSRPSSQGPSPQPSMLPQGASAQFSPQPSLQPAKASSSLAAAQGQQQPPSQQVQTPHVRFLAGSNSASDKSKQHHPQQSLQRSSSSPPAPQEPEVTNSAVGTSSKATGMPTLLGSTSPVAKQGERPIMAQSSSSSCSKSKSPSIRHRSCANTPAGAAGWCGTSSSHAHLTGTPTRSRLSVVCPASGPGPAGQGIVPSPSGGAPSGISVNILAASPQAAWRAPLAASAVTTQPLTSSMVPSASGGVAGPSLRQSSDPGLVAALQAVALVPSTTAQAATAGNQPRSSTGGFGSPMSSGRQQSMVVAGRGSTSEARGVQVQPFRNASVWRGSMSTNQP